jgi:DNA-binding NarL/FixJ family response regulator
LAPSSIRVLVADDSEAFSNFICSKLQRRPFVQVICQVSDGLMAVREAQHLQPHLVLLEVRLPTLNGIAAARQIRKFSPKSKILIVSQESSADMPQLAFNAGASGYVVKVDLGGELLPAVRAVLRGEYFVGRRFAGHDFAGWPTYAREWL